MRTAKFNATSFYSPDRKKRKEPPAPAAQSFILNQNSAKIINFRLLLNTQVLQLA